MLMHYCADLPALLSHNRQILGSVTFGPAACASNFVRVSSLVRELQAEA
jgi:hypothetical protein